MAIINKFCLNSENIEVIKALDQDGYVVFENIFSDYEVNQIKQIFYNDFPKECIKRENGSSILPNASHVLENFQDHVVLNKNLLFAMKKVFNNEEFAYTSHSDMHINVSSPWHKDDGGGKYFAGLDNYFDSNICKVFKIGLYLRDCSKFGGLTIKKGSHLKKDIRFGEEQYLPSKAGDIVIFDVRITHKGDSKSKTGIISRLIDKLNFKEKKQNISYERLSCFFTFGLNNIYTQTFAEKNMNRQVIDKSDKFLSMPKRFRSLLIENGISFYF